MADEKTSTPTADDYRVRLRDQFGAGRFRVRCDGRIEVKTAQRGGWMPWGRVGDAETDRRLFTQACVRADADQARTAPVIDFRTAARAIKRARKAARQASRARDVGAWRDAVRAAAHAAL